MVQRWLRAKYRKVAWFAENVVCAEFAGAMKVLIPGSKYKVVNHASFSAENRKRAYFASAEFGPTVLTRLTGTCTVAEFFDIDQGRGPYLTRSGSSGSKPNCAWLFIDQQASILTSNGLLMQKVRTGLEWRVPSDDTAKYHLFPTRARRTASISSNTSVGRGLLTAGRRPRAERLSLHCWPSAVGVLAHHEDCWPWSAESASTLVNAPTSASARTSSTKPAPSLAEPSRRAVAAAAATAPPRP